MVTLALVGVALALLARYAYRHPRPTVECRVEGCTRRVSGDHIDPVCDDHWWAGAPWA